MGAAQRYYDSAVTMSLGNVDSANPWLLPRIPLYSENPNWYARLKLLSTYPSRRRQPVVRPVVSVVTKELGARWDEKSSPEQGAGEPVSQDGASVL